MKKNLLLCLALGFTVMVNAQQYYTVKPDYRMKVATALTDNKVDLEPVKSLPITHAKFIPPAHNVNREVTITPIGQSANAFSYEGGSRTILWADNDLNTVINIHRETGVSPNYSGNLNMDISIDRGDSFISNVRIYTSTQPGGTYNTDAARYPQGAIYNPVGNTSLHNAYYTYAAPTLDGSNHPDTWGGYCYGRTSLIDFTDTTKHLFTSDSSNGFYLNNPDGFYVTRQGVALFTDLNMDLNIGSWEYQNEILATRGLWNPAISDFEYEIGTIPFTILPESSIPFSPKCAFGADGQTGYIVVLGDDGSVPFSHGAYYPVIFKTTDAGETWEDPVSIEIGGPDGIDAIVYDWLTDQQIIDFFGNPPPARDEILYTTAFDCDIVVDAFNNVHIAVDIGIGNGSYAIYALANYFAVWDLTSFDGSQTWNAYMCGPLTTFRGVFGGGELAEDNRPNASIDVSGTKVFISWADTHYEGVNSNIQPDIFIRAFDFSSFMMTEAPVNVTEYTEAWLQAFFFAAPYYVFVDGGTCTIPFTYQQMDPADPLQPVTYMFVNGYTLTQDDFNTPMPGGAALTADAGPDATICASETCTLAGSATGYTSLGWSTSGDGTFSDNTILNPVYTQGTGDITGGSVTLTLTAYSDTYQVSDVMVLTIDSPTGIPATPEGPASVDYAYVQSSEFTTTGATNADSYMWELQPDSLGTITSTTTTATANWSGAKGTAAITVTGVNACGEGEVSEARMVTVNNTIGIAETQDKDIAILIAPNPNNGEFNIRLASKDNEAINLKIIDALGNTVYQLNGIQVAQSISMKITLDKLKKGVYFIIVDDGKTIKAQKLVIQ